MRSLLLFLAFLGVVVALVLAALLVSHYLNLSVQEIVTRDWVSELNTFVS